MANGDPLFHMSRRIDDLGDNLRTLDTKFDTHVGHVNTVLTEIKTEITKLTAAEEAVEKEQEGRQRRRELRYNFAMTLAMVCSVGAAILSLAH